MSPEKKQARVEKRKPLAVVGPQKGLNSHDLRERRSRGRKKGDQRPSTVKKRKVATIIRAREERHNKKRRRKRKKRKVIVHR